MTPRELFASRARQQKERLALQEAEERKKAKREERIREIVRKAIEAEEQKQREHEAFVEKMASEGFLSVTLLAKERGVTEAAIYRSLNVGNIESRKIGNRRYVSVSSYDQWKADAMAYRREYAKRGGETMKASWTERLEIARSLAPDTPITITEFQRVTGVSLSAVYRAIKLGKLETIKDGHSRYILPRAYEAYRESSKVNRGLAARRAIEARKRKCADRKKAA